MDTNSKIYKLLKFLLFYWTTILFIYLIYGAYVICTITTYWINYRWFVFASFMIFIFITLTISFVTILKIIKLSNEINKPIPKKIKIKLFLFPVIMSIILLIRFSSIKEWDYSKFKMNDATKVFLEAKYQYLPNEVLTKELSTSKWFKYLQKKFETVSVAWIDDYNERYRIGSLNENAIFGKDFIILERNKKYNAIDNTVNYQDATMSPAFCLYALVQKGNRKSIIRTIKLFYGNIYMKFGSFKGIVFWIRWHFKQFKRIKK